MSNPQWMNGLGDVYRLAQREELEAMARDELQEWLEFRGCECTDIEALTTSLLRATALEDFDGEQGPLVFRHLRYKKRIIELNQHLSGGKLVP